MPKHVKKPATPSESEEEVPSSLESESDDQNQLGANNAFGDEDSEGFGEEGEMEQGEDEFDEEASEQTENEQSEQQVEEAVEPGDSEMLTNIEAKRDAAIKSMLSKEDLGIINVRIKETVRILTNFQELREEGKSRSDYMRALKEDISASYDYNADLLELLFDLFPPAECLEFIEANEN